MIDYNDIEKSERKQLIAGDYFVFIKEVELTQSKNQENMLKFKFEVMGGDFKGFHIYNYILLRKNLLWKLGLVMDAVKFKGRFEETIPSELEETFLGKKLKIKIELESVDGKVFTRIIKFYALTDEQEAFFEDYDATLISHANPENSSDTEDDLPF